ncbi:MAG: hypothetical protein N3F04_01475 [Candidatus Nezhaarchaeota archaeon]|nr:hypothetical protein [Candidatus Nezhaarchaeota archaeon]MCX8141448.1 hypothetical protein [Candidatus Nezhaarchaeota archaeon]MDW8049714.1 hypothetical protein [Nitrososphaerota archaeon]
MSRQAKPVIVDSPDFQAFLNYARSYYFTIAKLAWDVAQRMVEECNIPRDKLIYVWGKIFETFSSPLRYLYNEWDLLPPDYKDKFMSDEAKSRIEEAAKELLSKHMSSLKATDKVSPQQ